MGTPEDSTELPTVDAVVHFEKIGRVGEGTYGVVCALLISHPQSDCIEWTALILSKFDSNARCCLYSFVCHLHLLQTRREIGGPEKSWL